MSRLKTFATVAMAGLMAGTVAACQPRSEAEIAADPAAPQVTVATESLRIKNQVDAIQIIGSDVQAVEFTPVTAPNKQCIAVLSTYYRTGHGGLQCWDKPPPVIVSAAPAAPAP